MKHSYTGIPAFSQHGLPTTEFAHLKMIAHFTNRTDWGALKQTEQSEKLATRTAKVNHNKLKRNPYFKEYQNELIGLIVGQNRTPNFGSFRLTITKHGI